MERRTTDMKDSLKKPKLSNKDIKRAKTVPTPTNKRSNEINNLKKSMDIFFFWYPRS